MSLPETARSRLFRATPGEAFSAAPPGLASGPVMAGSQHTQQDVSDPQLVAPDEFADFASWIPAE